MKKINEEIEKVQKEIKICYADGSPTSEKERIEKANITLQALQKAKEIMQKDRDLIEKISIKVLTDWKGQNEFVDWLESVNETNKRSCEQKEKGNEN